MNSREKKFVQKVLSDIFGTRQRLTDESSDPLRVVYKDKHFKPGRPQRQVRLNADLKHSQHRSET